MTLWFLFALMTAKGLAAYGCVRFLRCVRGGDQAARDFDARRFGLGLADQAGRAIARDLVDLIAIDRDIAARAPLARATSQRPEHRERRRRRHQGEQEPERHGGVTLSRPPPRHGPGREG